MSLWADVHARRAEGGQSYLLKDLMPEYRAAAFAMAGHLASQGWDGMDDDGTYMTWPYWLETLKD